jgi:hypothetical protein
MSGKENKKTQMIIVGMRTVELRLAARGMTQRFSVSSVFICGLICF